jgi:hypothetical protein
MLLLLTPQETEYTDKLTSILERVFQNKKEYTHSYYAKDAAVDGGDSLRVWTVAVNIPNSHRRQLKMGPTIPHNTKVGHYKMLQSALGWMRSYEHEDR